MLLKQTKIVASVSDGRCDVDFVKQLFEAGMSVMHMNMVHASREGFEALTANVHVVSNHIAILVDAKSPEIRTTASAESISYKTGDKVKVVGSPDLEITRECIVAPCPSLTSDPNIGGITLISDGDLELEIVDKANDYSLCEVKNDAILGSCRGIDVPGVRINLPSLAEKDRNNIPCTVEKDIDLIAHSFVRNRQDVLDIREILDVHNSDIKITAKIEDRERVDNIDEILEMIDGIMMARGDSDIRVPQERIPEIQRMLIRKRTLAKKPATVATQVLHTMVNNPHPARAEVTDTVNVIYYRMGALMLSGETAYGRCPVEAVRTMTKITAQAEEDKLEENDIRIPLDEGSNNVMAFLARQIMKATSKLKICAIVTDSYSGRTARNPATFRGGYPVSAIYYKEKAVRRSASSYGMEAIYMPELANRQEYYPATLRCLLKEGRLQPSDMAGYLSNGKAGTKTSFLEISVVEGALKHAEGTILPNNNRYLQFVEIYFMQEAESVDEHILQHIDLESDYLKSFYRDTHVKLLRPRIAPGYSQGRMLKMSVEMIRPRQILEVGTYSGYSAPCLAEGLAGGGVLYTLGINDEQEDFTRPWLEKSPFADKIRFYTGDALELVPYLGVTFDMASIDGDKRRYIEYYKMTLVHLSAGGYIIADDTLWNNHVLEQPRNTDAQTVGIKAFNDLVAEDVRVEKVILSLRNELTIIRKK